LEFQVNFPTKLLQLAPWHLGIEQTPGDLVLDWQRHQALNARWSDSIVLLTATQSCHDALQSQHPQLIHGLKRRLSIEMPQLQQGQHRSGSPCPPVPIYEDAAGIIDLALDVIAVVGQNQHSQAAHAPGSRLAFVFVHQMRSTTSTYNDRSLTIPPFFFFQAAAFSSPPQTSPTVTRAGGNGPPNADSKLCQ
jgi:hypothetical protein